ncbi:MAG: hypothetical protein MJ206_03380 [Bacilli bacterium]|nr:hypothetical protein [Bacilli bacterium]
MKTKILLTLSPLLLCACGTKEVVTKCRVELITNGHITCEEFAESSYVDVPNNKDFTMHLSLEYVHDTKANWITGKEPTKDSEGELDKPNEGYLLPIKNIHVSVDEESCDEAFTYAEDLRNLCELTIKKEFLSRKVVVNLETEKMDVLNLFGYQLGDELMPRYKTETNPDGDISITFASAYQNKMYRIKTLKEEGFPVFENDNIDVTFKVITGNTPLPNNIWYRTNARYTLLGQDFNREYSSDMMTCHITVPHYIVKDHGLFKVK